MNFYEKSLIITRWVDIFIGTELYKISTHLFNFTKFQKFNDLPNYESYDLE